MDLDGRDEHLSRIETLWSVVLRAHKGPGDEAGEAHAELMRRYAGAAYRYLLGALRDADAADELAQEFALRVVRGDFRRADPGRGRFRDFLKTSLYHLVVDHQKARNRRRGVPLVADVADSGEAVGADDEFEQSWRDELLALAWKGLADGQKAGGPPFYEVLRFRADHPELSSTQMAEGLGRELGRPMTAASLRQTLHRARERFADLLLDEVARSLGRPSRDEIEAELIDLGLLDHCRPALARRAEPGEG